MKIKAGKRELIDTDTDKRFVKELDIEAALNTRLNLSAMPEDFGFNVLRTKSRTFREYCFQRA